MIHIHGDGGHAKVVRTCTLQQGTGGFRADELDGWIVAVGDNAARKKEVERLVSEGKRFVARIHESAVVDPLVGVGTVVMAGAVVQPGCKIGKHVILNTNCSVDHDCEIGDFAHIAPGAVLCCGVKVGEGALVGAGAVCVPGAVIPPWSLVKAGTVAK